MYKLCAFVFPSTNLPKFSSVKDKVMSDLAPSGASPLPTLPVFLRSRYHDSSLPAAFLSLKVKTAPPVLIAFFSSASSEEREAEMASNAAEAGNSSIKLLEIRRR